MAARRPWWRRLGRAKKTKSDQSSKTRRAPAPEADLTESTTGSDRRGGAAALATKPPPPQPLVDTSPIRTSLHSSEARSSEARSSEARSSVGSDLRGGAALAANPPPRPPLVDTSLVRTSSRSSETPSSEAPSSEAPSSEAPSSEAPSSEAPSSEARSSVARNSVARSSVSSSAPASTPAISSRCFYGSMASPQKSTPPSPTRQDEDDAEVQDEDDEEVPLEIQFQNVEFVPDQPQKVGNRKGRGGGGVLARALEAAARNEKEISIPPQDFLDDFLQKRGYSTERFPSLRTAYFNPPTPLQKASFGTYLVDAVRDDDVEEVTKLLSSGLSPNPSNAHGETLLHVAAKHGHADMVQLLLDFGASVQCVDDLGRSPLHEACWSDRPSLRVVDILLDKDPRLLYLTDTRGATPLSYVPRSEWRKWTLHLEKQADEFWPARDVSRDGIQAAPPLTLLPPGSRPLPDPVLATGLLVKVAKLLAMGRLTPQEVSWLMAKENDDDESSFEDCMSDSMLSRDEYFSLSSEDDSDEESM